MLEEVLRCFSVRILGTAIVFIFWYLMFDRFNYITRYFYGTVQVPVSYVQRLSSYFLRTDVCRLFDRKAGPYITYVFNWFLYHVGVSDPKYTSFTICNCIQTALISIHQLFGIATGYGLDDRWIGIQAPVGSRIFSSPLRPDWLWGPLNLLSNGYRRLFPRG
jgi:hypothetical protein